MNWEVIKEKLKAKLKRPELEEEKDYFKLAKTWSNDFYMNMTASRNRYRLAFMTMAFCCVVLTTATTVVLLSKNVQLVVVHEGQSGYSYVTTAKVGRVIPNAWLRTQSEIARYVVARESYDPVLYQHQSQAVNLMSSDTVSSQYIESQSERNKIAPVNVLGAKGYRTVHVNTIMRLPDTEGHKLAQVSFSTTDHFFGSAQTMTTQYTALVSWGYQGVPTTPSDMLANWDGFEITKYDVQSVNNQGG